MISYRRRERVIAAALTALSGYVDAMGFIALGGYFVSFMSGNSTRLGVGLESAWSKAALPAMLIGLFVAGLLSLRPDRTQIIEVVRKAVKAKHYAVVVNLKNGQSVSKVRDMFSRHSSQVVESIQ